MSQDFFSSDHHFFHKNICEFAGRPFAHLPDMHEKLIEDHNAVVTNEDRWWCLGDFSFGDSPESTQILKRMNGQKFLVRGNHDHRHRTADGWMDISWYRELNMKREDGPPHDGVCLMHFPIMSWHKMHYGSYMLHGHSHGNLLYPASFATARILDVGVDNIWKLRGDYSPLSWEEIRETLKDRRPASLDHHVVGQQP